MGSISCHLLFIAHGKHTHTHTHTHIHTHILTHTHTHTYIHTHTHTHAHTNFPDRRKFGRRTPILKISLNLLITKINQVYYNI